MWSKGILFINFVVFVLTDDRLQQSISNATYITPQLKHSGQIVELPTSANDQNKRFQLYAFDNKFDSSVVLDNSMVNDIINDILISSREGRNLEGYDVIYADPAIKSALQLGNDTITRSYIRHKLCSLGLMNCEDTEERRQYYFQNEDVPPHNIIYAQPVAIRPVGQPLPAIPIRRPTSFSGESPSNGNDFSTILSSNPVSSISKPFDNFKKPSHTENFKPIYEPGFDKDIEYDYSLTEKKTKYANIDPNVYFNEKNINFSPIVDSTSSNYEYGNSGNLNYNLEEYKKNFKQKDHLHSNGISALNNNYANKFTAYQYLTREPTKHSSDPKYSPHIIKQHSLGTLSHDKFNVNHHLINTGNLNLGNRYESNNEFFVPNNQFGQNTFKDKLLDSNLNDCTCISYEQCINLDQSGRKDDLYLAIDPRNSKKNIDADTKEVAITSKKDNEMQRFDNKQYVEKTGIDLQNKTVLSDVKRKKRNSFNSPKSDETETFTEQGESRSLNCGPGRVCCRLKQVSNNLDRHKQCGVKYSQGIAGRIKTPVYIDGDSEFGEYPWQVAILKKVLEEKESVYVCGGTLISSRYIITAAHCIKSYSGRDLRARLGEWDVNHDVEFFPYIEIDVVSVIIHNEFYAGALYNDIAVLKLAYDIDFQKNPHINPACLPSKFEQYENARCWTTGWGKDAFGDFGKYQNILKEVDVPVISNTVCEHQLRQTRLGYNFKLHPGFICAGGENGKDACKGDGGGPMVCQNHGRWQVAGIVSWGVGCGEVGIPGVYTRVSHYLDWIHRIIDN